MIVILFTGGTIAMRNDPTARGNTPALTGAEIVKATRGIDNTSAVETEDWGHFPGPHMNIARMWALRNRIAEHLARDEVAGVVVTHGTDTLEESAYFTARALSSPKPVVFTGAMRTQSDLGWDGPANLFEAVHVAANPASIGQGVMVVLRELMPEPIDLRRIVGIDKQQRLIERAVFERIDARALGPQHGALGVFDVLGQYQRRVEGARAVLCGASQVQRRWMIDISVGARVQLVFELRRFAIGLLLTDLGEHEIE